MYSWKKLSSFGRNSIIVSFTVMFFGMGWLYIESPEQLCNNYLLIEQITLGWGFVTMAICLVIYLVYFYFIDHSQYS
ncbi:hypothetical protein [Bacillus sp. Marseille-Q3570]|uniref:hypothetical protein n=1 Tax=Bacillus sp. Marseille-Q3570 TaxID=2963522 RepID=UPI0021B828F1|nr:hypothetical protein [Bacillus sp. Marseille-Q3570]